MGLKQLGEAVGPCGPRLWRDQGIAKSSNGGRPAREDEGGAEGRRGRDGPHERGPKPSRPSSSGARRSPVRDATQALGTNTSPLYATRRLNLPRT